MPGAKGRRRPDGRAHPTNRGELGLQCISNREGLPSGRAGASSRRVAAMRHRTAVRRGARRAPGSGAHVWHNRRARVPARGQVSRMHKSRLLPPAWCASATTTEITTAKTTAADSRWLRESLLLVGCLRFEPPSKDGTRSIPGRADDPGRVTHYVGHFADSRPAVRHSFRHDEPKGSEPERH
jgi:hypothetical protein